MWLPGAPGQPGPQGPPRCGGRVSGPHRWPGPWQEAAGSAGTALKPRCTHAVTWPTGRTSRLSRKRSAGFSAQAPACLSRAHWTRAFKCQTRGSSLFADTKHLPEPDAQVDIAGGGGFTRTFPEAGPGEASRGTPGSGRAQTSAGGLGGAARPLRPLGSWAVNGATMVMKSKLAVNGSVDSPCHCDDYS